MYPPEPCYSDRLLGLGPPREDRSNPGPDFEDYLQNGYRSIAVAHFRTNEGIASFFRYYLLIMSAPIAVLAGCGKRGVQRGYPF